MTTAVLSWLGLGPSASGGPTDSPESPIGWALFAALRRLTDDDDVGEQRVLSAADPAVAALKVDAGQPMLKAAAAPVNRAPTAVADSATTAEDTVRTLTAVELVGNDTDPKDSAMC